MDETPTSPKVISFLGIPIYRKLRTGEKQVPWSSVFILSLMWFAWGFTLFASGTALTFTIYRYTKDPRIISLVMTASFLIMLAPVINYTSDQIWTRCGRRRPFIFVAWLGGLIGMFAFAFLPQVAHSINLVLGLVGIRPVSELVILVAIIACFMKMWDGNAPLEPLFLECVPPHQRGRFFAIRSILVTLAATFFYQVLWPFFDEPVDLFGYLGHPGVLMLTGEQLIYLFAGSLFLITGFYLVFCIEETQEPSAPNRRFLFLFFGDRVIKSHGPDARQAAVRTGKPRLIQTINQIPIVTFIVNFFKGVFLSWANYPFYILLVVPGIEYNVWGNFGPLMGNMQFGYSKANQALYALPLQIFSMALITPFAGWYSDKQLNLRWWLRILLWTVSAACFAGMVWMLRRYSPADSRELAEVWVLFAITGLITAGVGCFYVPVIETVLDWVGRDHARVWITLLLVVQSFVFNIILYIWIRCSPDRTPTLMVWMVFAVIGSGTGGISAALMGTFVGPMVYDYVPRSRLGTIGSGQGVYDALVKFGVANLGAWWVVFYTAHFYKPKHVPYDYTSIYLLLLILFIPIFLAKAYFLRQVITGRLPKRGILDLQEAESLRLAKLELQEKKLIEVVKSQQAEEGP